jgi:hypothetical protein
MLQGLRELPLAEEDVTDVVVVDACVRGLRPQCLVYLQCSGVEVERLLEVPVEMTDAAQIGEAGRHLQRLGRGFLQHPPGPLVMLHGATPVAGVAPDARDVEQVTRGADGTRCDPFVDAQSVLELDQRPPVVGDDLVGVPEVVVAQRAQRPVGGDPGGQVEGLPVVVDGGGQVTVVQMTARDVVEDGDPGRPVLGFVRDHVERLTEPVERRPQFTAHPDHPADVVDGDRHRDGVLTMVTFEPRGAFVGGERAIEVAQLPAHNADVAQVLGRLQGQAGRLVQPQGAFERGEGPAVVSRPEGREAEP